MMTLLSFSFQLLILSFTVIGTVELLVLTVAALFHKKSGNYSPYQSVACSGFTGIKSSKK
jgi:hypothetical protein